MGSLPGKQLSKDRSLQIDEFVEAFFSRRSKLSSLDTSCHVDVVSQAVQFPNPGQVS